MTDLKTFKRNQSNVAPAIAVVSCAAIIPDFDELPDSALVRQSTRSQPQAPHQTSSAALAQAATLWRRVQSGSFPKPKRLSGGRITCWKVGDIREWITAQEGGVA